MGDEDKLREYLRRVTRDLYDVRQRLMVVDSRESEPIAIVWIGCRYPGRVRSPEDLAAIVSSGVDAVGDFRSRGQVRFRWPEYWPDGTS